MSYLSLSLCLLHPSWLYLHYVVLSAPPYCLSLPLVWCRGGCDVEVDLWRLVPGVEGLVDEVINVVEVVEHRLEGLTAEGTRARDVGGVVSQGGVDVIVIVVVEQPPAEGRPGDLMVVSMISITNPICLFLCADFRK